MTAQEVIGVQSKNDWILNPKDHASSLPKEAGPLKRILVSDAIRYAITLGHLRRLQQRLDEIRKKRRIPKVIQKYL